MKNLKKIFDFFYIIVGLAGSVILLYSAIQEKESIDRFIHEMVNVFMYVSFAYLGITFYIQKITDKNRLKKIKYLLIILLSYTVLCFTYFMYHIFKHGLSSDLLTLLYLSFAIIFGVGLIVGFSYLILKINKEV